MYENQGRECRFNVTQRPLQLKAVSIIHSEGVSEPNVSSVKCACATLSSAASPALFHIISQRYVFLKKKKVTGHKYMLRFSVQI